MARYEITFNTNDPVQPFAGFDEITGECVEATNPESLGVYMPEFQQEIFKNLEPGETQTDQIMTYFRQY